MPKHYASPQVHTLGTVRDLTAQISSGPNDKIGSSADALTALAATLGLGIVDGTIQGDK